MQEPGPSAIGRSEGSLWPEACVAAVLGPRPGVLHGRVEEVARLLVGAEQGLDAAAEVGVAGAGCLEVGGALGRRGLLQRRHEDRFFTHTRASRAGST